MRARERGRLVIRHGSLDTLALEGPLSERITLGKAVRAGESREGEVSILREATDRKAAPVKTPLLLVRALVVGVGRAVEAWCVNVPTSSDLLGSQA